MRAARSLHLARPAPKPKTKEEVDHLINDTGAPK